MKKGCGAGLVSHRGASAASAERSADGRQTFQSTPEAVDLGPHSSRNVLVPHRMVAPLRVRRQPPTLGSTMLALKISVYSVVFFFIGIFMFGFLASDPSRTPSRKDLEE